MEMERSDNALTDRLKKNKKKNATFPHLQLACKQRLDTTPHWCQCAEDELRATKSTVQVAQKQAKMSAN